MSFLFISKGLHFIKVCLKFIIFVNISKTQIRHLTLFSAFRSLLFAANRLASGHSGKDAACRSSKQQASSLPRPCNFGGKAQSNDNLKKNENSRCHHGRRKGTHGHSARSK
ncbi:MAG: hypothetical protein LKJ86_05895 [Oscillibacter sp.]|nr:hypothetical protein [Oscillibacter sp.]